MSFITIWYDRGFCEHRLETETYLEAAKFLRSHHHENAMVFDDKRLPFMMSHGTEQSSRLVRVHQRYRCCP